MTGIENSPYRSKTIHCALLVAAMLSGCQKEKSGPAPILATPTHPLDIPLVEKPAVAAAPQASAPLRRALNELPPPSNRLSAALASEVPFIAFQLSRDAGQTNLRARFASNSADPGATYVAGELEALGFRKIDDQSWSRSVSPEGHAAFEQAAWKRL